ncbi:MAG: AAA family ATPase, partial [Kiritimatiellae bacterium]|nr:AAA family ATPase [Kiritimatiellia bacterium]
MKSSEIYKITAVRLVEFHNLGTTTIEIPEGGHLFLLGDNGSGKTTILDAVHLVLTAGREMEFNSAARVAGSKDSGGRTYQGIVLRYNAVTGRTAREAGITYAAVELRSDTGRVCSLVVGLSARGMDVQYERWGGIASVGVSELPLMIEDGGRLRAASQSEFKSGITTLTGGKYYPHINDYANAVGARLFGGEAKYADVCKLLRTGKAYREIAARAANYDDLFRQLLEDPSRDTFEPLLKGLREIEESKGKLDQIDERASYLND